EALHEARAAVAAGELEQEHDRGDADDRDVGDRRALRTDVVLERDHGASGASASRMPSSRARSTASREAQTCSSVSPFPLASTRKRSATRSWASARREGASTFSNPLRPRWDVVRSNP